MAIKLITIYAYSEASYQVMKSVGFFMTDKIRIEPYLIDTAKDIDEVFKECPPGYISVVPIIGGVLDIIVAKALIEGLVKQGKDVFSVAMSDAQTLKDIFQDIEKTIEEMKPDDGMMQPDDGSLGMVGMGSLGSYSPTYPSVVAPVINNFVRTVSRMMAEWEDFKPNQAISWFTVTNGERYSRWYYKWFHQS